MTKNSLDRSADHPGGDRFLPLLLLLFVGSGCSALIYEIVWFQLLQLVIGSSAVSLGVLLGTFMGGMCLGSLILPRLISPQQHPLRVYALLELGIGIIGLLVLFGMPLVDDLYTTHVGHGFLGILLRGVVCAVCLLPPTLLMGATLPAIGRWIETTPEGVSWLGFFYGGNIVGAVFGCLLAGFYLLRVHDLATATFVAATINGAVALIGLGLALLAPHEPPDEDMAYDESTAPEGAWAVYLAIALSGMTALGAEVIWTRLLSLMLGATVYTFSIILAVFLVGLGIGSSLGALLARGTSRPRVILGCCQLLLAAAITWTACMLAQSLPYWPIEPSLSTSPWFNFQLDLLRCAWAILPAAILWGASFPLALAAVASPGKDPGRLVGGVYAANTVGAIFGAIGFSMVLIPWVGTQVSHRLMIGLAAAAALLLFGPLLRSFTADTTPDRKPVAVPFRIAAMVVVLAIVGILVQLSRSVPEVPGLLIAYGRYLPSRVHDQGTEVIYVGEGMNASVAVTKLPNGVRNFHVSGKVEASTEPQDMRLQRMLGHMSALAHPKPRKVLVVGCGAGVTAGSFVVHPDVERIVICDIEPLIPQVVAEHFKKENYQVIQDQRTEVVCDDARHYVLTTQETFDIITSDPIHPWVKGAASLYTREYFEHCKRRLNPGGVVTLWVPLYESDLDTVQSEIATFFDVFPNGTIWGNTRNGAGYDIILLGQVEPTKIDMLALETRLNRSDHARVAESLNEVGFTTVIELLSTYGGQASDLAPWLKNAQINRDGNLRLQYLAGLGLNNFQGGTIYEQMLLFREFPEDLFIGPEDRKQALRAALAKQQ